MVIMGQWILKPTTSMNVAEELPIVSKVSYTNFGNNSINAPSNFVESAKEVQALLSIFLRKKVRSRH